MIVCEKCKTKNADDAAYCRSCGSKLSQEPAEKPSEGEKKDYTVWKVLGTVATIAVVIGLMFTGVLGVAGIMAGSLGIYAIWNTKK